MGNDKKTEIQAMTKKQEYLNHLNKESTEWIRASMKSPSTGMRPIHIALHAIVLRRRSAL